MRFIMMGLGFWCTATIVCAQETTNSVVVPETTATVQVTTATAKVADGTSVTLPSGVAYKDLVIGTGEESSRTLEHIIHYTLRLNNGTVVDSSRTKLLPTPLRFKPDVPSVVAGMALGVAGMRVGGQRLITISPSHGYGEKGSGKVPPNATLHFEVELVGFGKPPAPAP